MLYKDSNAEISARVDDLLGRMTLEEKVEQLGSRLINSIVDSKNKIVQGKMADALKDGCGQITRSAWMLGDIEPDESAKLINEIQEYLLTNTRLKIPALLHEECLNGHQVKYATAFPQSIGVASAFCEDTTKEMATALKKQMMSIGARQGLAPVLDVARDARWGRCEETYGEDPYLIASVGKAYIKGLQTNDLKSGVMATAKHFLGYSVTEGGMNWAPSHINKRELREVYGFPFEAAIKEANLASIMNSYSEIDGVPCGISKEILTDLLRGEYGFDGIVVSDYGALNTAHSYHKVGKDMQDISKRAIEAGMDVELPNTQVYGSLLINAVREGKISIDVIDISVRRVLQKKFELGLFENPYANVDEVINELTKEEYKQTAEKLARKSFVLLKNDKNTLPVSKATKSIALIGPSAASVRNLLGDYNYASNLEGQLGMLNSFSDKDLVYDMLMPYETIILKEIKDRTNLTFKSLKAMPNAILNKVLKEVGFSIEDKQNERKKLEQSLKIIKKEGSEGLVRKINDITSILDELKNKLPKTKINYAKGCEIIGGNMRGFKEAVNAAKKSDIIVAVLGDKAGLDIGSTSGESRDRTNINLPGYQLELLKELRKLNKPIVLVLINGRPVSLTWEDENIDAILECWLPGERGAKAVVDTLVGDVNPSGKLPISFPRTVGQVPTFYNHKPTGGRSQWAGDYVEASSKPLYAFGHGLSYTQFEYSNICVDNEEINALDEVKISFDIKNIGKVQGEEVVQLYLGNKNVSMTRPVKQLYGFKRVNLEPDENAKVTFTVPSELLAFYDIDMNFVVEPSDVEVMIGGSSREIQLQSSFKICGDTKLVKEKKFFSAAKINGGEK